MEDADFLTYQESKAIVESGFDPVVYQQMLQRAAIRRQKAERAFLHWWTGK